MCVSFIYYHSFINVNIFSLRLSRSELLVSMLHEVHWCAENHACSRRYWPPQQSRKVWCSWSPTIMKLLGGLRECPKQSSLHYMWLLSATSTTSLIQLTLLHGNALNQAEKAPSGRDGPPASAAGHVSACGRGLTMLLEECECHVSTMPGSQPMVHLVGGSGKALHQVATWNLGPDTQQLLPLLCGWWILLVTFKLLARWLLQ